MKKLKTILFATGLLAAATTHAQTPTPVVPAAAMTAEAPKKVLRYAFLVAETSLDLSRSSTSTRAR